MTNEPHATKALTERESILLGRVMQLYRATRTLNMGGVRPRLRWRLDPLSDVDLRTMPALLNGQPLMNTAGQLLGLPVCTDPSVDRGQIRLEVVPRNGITPRERTLELLRKMTALQGQIPRGMGPMVVWRMNYDTHAMICTHSNSVSDGIMGTDVQWGITLFGISTTVDDTLADDEIRMEVRG